MTFSALARGIVEIAEQEGMVSADPKTRAKAAADRNAQKQKANRRASDPELTRLRARVAELEAAHEAERTMRITLGDCLRVANQTALRYKRELASPPSGHPADVTRALAKLFQMLWEQDGGISQGERDDWLYELRLADLSLQGDRFVLTGLGIAALAITEPPP